MQVSFSPFRKVVSELMKPHGDAAQLADQESTGGGLSGTHALITCTRAACNLAPNCVPWPPSLLDTTCQCLTPSAVANGWHTGVRRCWLSSRRTEPGG